MRIKLLSGLALIILASCNSSTPDHSADFAPAEVIDLGAQVTEDINQQVAGKAFLSINGTDRQNQFEVITWTVEIGGGSVSGSNSFYTLANHGGPHVDAPNHVGLEGGIDSYSIDAYSGSLKVFDVSDYPTGFSVSRTVFEDQGIEPGDVVMVYTSYQPPQDDTSFPEVVTLTRDAAEYLASIPIRAFATDAFSVENMQEQAQVESNNLTAQVVPIHHSFLSRGIPIYEQLFNVESLIGKENMFFVGVPVNVRDGDGMIVRPVVFVY